MGLLRSLACFVLLLVVFAAFVAKNRSKFEQVFCSRSSLASRAPKYVLYTNSSNYAALMTVDSVLQRLGLERIGAWGQKPDQLPPDWDLLWSHDHHEDIREFVNFRHTKLHQKMNHFPGNFALVAKHMLPVPTRFDFMPAAFTSSLEAQAFARRHPEKRLVVKSKGNRGVKLARAEDMDFRESLSASDVFAQEFVEDPLLWSGHKFDFSVFVAITSVRPLRLYYYGKNVNLRFCLRPYDTSDPEAVDAYVIGSKFISAQNFVGTKEFIEQKFSNRDTFEFFMAEHGANLDEIWEKVEDLIVKTVASKEKIFVDGISKFGTRKPSHFELFRFDMMFNENFDIFLLEVNMSPNMMPHRDTSLNRFMFENVLYDLFNLVGIGTSYAKEQFRFPSDDVFMMVSHPNALTTNIEDCMSEACKSDCKQEKCKVCWKCLPVDQMFERFEAYREHQALGGYKRLFPPTEQKFNDLSDFFRDHLVPESITHAEWFFEMCKKSRNFC